MITPDQENEIRQALCKEWGYLGRGWDFFEYNRHRNCIVRKQYITEEDEEYIKEEVEFLCDGELYCLQNESGVKTIAFKDFSIQSENGVLFTDKNAEWMIYITEDGIVIFGSESLIDLVIYIFIDKQHLLNTLR